MMGTATNSRELSHLRKKMIEQDWKYVTKVIISIPYEGPIHRCCLARFER
jgi:hypothetical protein